MILNVGINNMKKKCCGMQMVSEWGASLEWLSGTCRWACDICKRRIRMTDEEEQRVRYGYYITLPQD